MSFSPQRKQSRAMSSSPIKSRFCMPVITTLKENCPVSDQSIGIISENDHRVGLCLCKFCECGQHICPNPIGKILYPNSTYTSKYKKDYQKGNFDLPLKPEPKAYRPNMLKMDLRTTNQMDFQPFTVVPKKKNSYQIPISLMSSQGRSAYSNDFINWGPNNIQIEKRFQPPVRSQDIPFRGQSSYQKAFVEFDQKKNEFYKTNISDIGAANSTIALGPNEAQGYQTTYGDNMQNYSKNELNRIVKVNGEVNGLLPSCSAHFQTTSQGFYQNHLSESKDPRKVRLELAKKRLR